MDCFDHYPFPALIADVTAQLTAPLPGGTPARDAPALPPPTRYRLKFGVMECTICGYAAEFCGCAKRAAPDVSAAQDGAAAASLNRRVADCQGGR